MSGGLAIAILAAGSSRRFGGGKLDMDCAGKPLGRWALDTARTIAGADVVVVAGKAPPAFSREAEIAWNATAEDGLGTSVATAARWASANAARALLVILADMPLVTADTLERLSSGAPPAAVAYPNGRPGVPSCFPATMFDELARLGGDDGAGRLLARQAGLRLIETGPHELRDVDRPQDLVDVAAILSAR